MVAVPSAVANETELEPVVSPLRVTVKSKFVVPESPSACVTSPIEIVGS